VNIRFWPTLLISDDLDTGGMLWGCRGILRHAHTNTHKLAHKRQIKHFIMVQQEVEKGVGQGCVIQSFGTFNSVKYALTYKILSNFVLRNFGSVDFYSKMDPIRPKITQNVPNSSHIYYT